MKRSRFTAQQIIEAYQQTGSVWATGKALGLAGQTVHERLVAIGYPLAGRDWTDAECQELRDLYAAGVTLGEIAKRLGRPYNGIACKASELGLRTKQTREKKLPRPPAVPRSAALRHMDALEAGPLQLTPYARSQGISVDGLVAALQTHCPDRWAAYVETRSHIPHRECPYCGTTFRPFSGKQTYCTRRCGQHAQADRDYFGGKRRTAVGMADHTCQLCGKVDPRGLTPHHYLGKENDPGNDHLIALCRGCHYIVGFLGGRAFVDDPRAWELLITLAWLRRHGAEERMPGWALDVEVDIDSYVDTEAATA